MSRTKRVVLCAALPLLLAPMACSKTEDKPAATGSSTTTAKPAGGGSSTTAAGGGACTTPTEVIIEGKKFVPEKATVKAGGCIKWTNKDALPHEPKSGTPDAPSPEFDIDIAASGTGTSPALKTGTLKYYCDLHKSMLAEVTVE